jgi:hypothetical protein
MFDLVLSLTLVSLVLARYHASFPSAWSQEAAPERPTAPLEANS